MLDRLNGVGDDGGNRPEDRDGPTADQPEVLGDAGEDRPTGPDGSATDRPDASAAEPAAGSGGDGPGAPESLGEDDTVPLDRDSTVPLQGSDETVAPAGLGADTTVPIDGPAAEKIEGLGAEQTVPLEGLRAPAGPDHDGAGRLVGLGGHQRVEYGSPGSRNSTRGEDRPASGGGWERLAGLGRQRWRRGRERLAGGPAGDRIERLKATPAGQVAGEKVEQLRDWGDEHPIARRRLLIAVPSVAGLALLTGAVKAAEPKPKAATNVRAVARPRPSHPTEKTTVHTTPVQHKPIFTLDDYRRMTGAPPFPADAIALTIDDGPHPVWTPKILRLLDKYHVPAMFCMIGNQVLGHEEVARTVTKAGHQLANHTWSHPTQLAGRPRDQVRKEIERAQAKIRNTTGYAPKLFRSPGGDWSPTVLQETATAGLIPLDWDNDPRDWARPGVPHIKNKLMAARPGQILLCHDGGGDRSQTYAALSAVIPALTARGLRFVAL